jgi:hypothetical protein
METNEGSGKQLLADMLANGFNGDMSRLALALGRDQTELDDMLAGRMPVDDDLEMKIRGIAQEREIPIG